MDKLLNKLRGKSEAGITLVELLVVIVVLGILAAITVPAFSGQITKAEERVCYQNTIQVERMYHQHLELYENSHSGSLFKDFMQNHFDGELCPLEGEFTYEGGKVHCDVHVHEEDEDNNNQSGVPFL